MAITISVYKTLTDDQYQQLGCVYATALLGKAKVSHFDRANDINKKIAAEKAEKKPLLALFAYENSKYNKDMLVGFACAYIDNKDMELRDICTLTPRKNGLGTQILWKLFEQAKEMGIEAISLQASHCSEEFYLKYGFKLEEHGEQIHMYNDTIAETCERLRKDCKMKGYNKNMKQDLPKTYLLAA